MGIGKYKYYFRKPKSEITKDILKTLFLIGAINVAATSPYFLGNIWKSYSRWRKYPRKKFYDTFRYLKKHGYLQTEEVKRQIYIRLTDEGKKRAGFFQIDDLEIKKPKTWDQIWRLVVFDIDELRKSHREAFRGKLKELGFLPLQKSVWVYPYNCRHEIDLLGDFFGLDNEELKLIEAKNIGPDKKLGRGLISEIGFAK